MLGWTHWKLFRLHRLNFFVLMVRRLSEYEETILPKFSTFFLPAQPQSQQAGQYSHANGVLNQGPEIEIQIEGGGEGGGAPPLSYDPASAPPAYEETGNGSAQTNEYGHAPKQTNESAPPYNPY